MQKIGRNDPCPSGGGNKFKKCLSAHSCLDLKNSTTAGIWWVCDRWQVQIPSFEELHLAMSDIKELCPVKFDGFLEMAIHAQSHKMDFWPEFITLCWKKKIPDFPLLFRRLSSHLSAAENPDLPWLHSSAAACLREEHPEMFPEILAATLTQNPATTPMESLIHLVAWADNLGRNDACELLRERFDEFPQYIIEESEDDSDNEVLIDRTKEPKSDFLPEVIAALDKAWESFTAIESPSPEQVNAFIDELLLLPHEATPWSEVFNEVVSSDIIANFIIFHRLATELSPSLYRDFNYICWAAVEMVERLNAHDRLPEIVRTLLDFHSEECDPDALPHIVDALLAHGYVNETMELMSVFLPGLRDNEDVLSWVAPHVAEDIFLLRLGALISSGEPISQSVDQLLTTLCHGLDEDIHKDSARVPLEYLLQGSEVFPRDSFTIPSSTKDEEKQKVLWNRLQQAFVKVARDAWLTDHSNPSIMLIGLHIILRAIENDFTKPRKKGQKYSLNLLDHLNTASMNRLLTAECVNLFGIKKNRAKIMRDTCATLTRWVSRQSFTS